jgi:hypothetical protein
VRSDLTSASLVALLVAAAFGCSGSAGHRSPAVCPPSVANAPTAIPDAAKQNIAAPTTSAAAPAADATAFQNSLIAIGPRPEDPFCEPRLSPQIAEAMYQTANKLISAHGDHVSDGELSVIIPLLRLAAHSGHRHAQRRLGFYVVGYYMTDSMFWPRHKEIAADALAMLHVAAVDAPQIVGDDAAWILPYFEPASDKRSLPPAWVKQAKQVEAAFRKCRAAPAP